MKKKIILALSYVLLIALTLTATVAYFTDTDSAVNVMTVGNIDIEQHEYQRKDGVAHTGTAAEGDLVPFKQGQLLMPAYPMDNSAYTAEPTDLFFWGDYVYTGTAANGLWNDNKLGNVMDKMVFVENTGKNDLYFRTIIAFECPEGMEYSEGSNKEFMMNVNGSSLYEWNEVGYTSIDGVRYLIMEATYLNPLAPGNQAHPSLLQVVMTHNATMEDAAKLGETYEILVVTQAVQADMGVKNMTAKKALDTAFGDITLVEHPWKNAKLVQTNDPDELNAALQSGAQVIVNTDIVEVKDAAFDGNGTTVSLAGANGGDTYGYLAFAPGKGNNTVVENLNVTGSGFVEVGHYGEGGGTYTVNNLTITGLHSTLAVEDHGQFVGAAFSHYGTATLNNCTITGTTTKEGYTPYDLGCVHKTTTYVNGCEFGSAYLWSQAHVTVKDSKIGTIVSTAINDGKLGMLTLDDKAQVGTVKLIPSGNYDAALTVKAGASVDVLDLTGVADKSGAKITIESGATVGKIVANGVEYASIDAWKKA